jgi:hypothetical protein
MAELESAVAYWKASQYDYLNADASGKWLDLSGGGHDGTISGATFRSWPGYNYLYSSDDASAELETPDHADFDITGDIDVRGWGSLRNLSSSSDSYGYSKWLSGTQESILAATLDAASDGLKVYWSEDGSTLISEVSTVTWASVGIGNDDWFGWRITMEIDDGACNFYYRTDGPENIDSDSGWTQLGSADVSTASGSNGAATSIHSGTAKPAIGGHDGQQNYEGNIVRIVVCDGLGIANVVADWDADSYTATDIVNGTFSDGSHTWTLVNGTAAEISRIVDRSHFWFDGTNDKIVIDDHPDLNFTATESLTLGIACRSYDYTPATQYTLIDKRQGTGGYLGYGLQAQTDGDMKFVLQATGGTPDDQLAGASDGAAITAIGVRNVIDDDIEVFLDGTGSGSPTTDSTTGTLTYATDITIGAFEGSSQWFKGEIWSAALLRSALSDAQVVTLDEELNATYTASEADAYMDGVEFWVDAAHYSGAGVVNDRSGNNHNSSVDPIASGNVLHYDHDGTNYFYRPGVGDQDLSIADAAKFDITDDGDIDIRIKVALDDYTPAGYYWLVNKGPTSAATGWAFLFNNSSTGYLRFGAGSTVVNATAATGVTDGEETWLGVSFDATAGEVEFWKNDTNDADITTWTQIGTAVSCSTDNSTNTDPVQIAGHDSANIPTGKWFECEVRDGINGTLVVDWSADDYTEADIEAGTHTDGASNTVTLNQSGTAERARVVTRAHWWFDTNALIDFPDHANLDIGASDDFSLAFSGRSYDVTPGSSNSPISKRTSGGYEVQLHTSGVWRAVWHDGSVSFTDDASGTDGEAVTIVTVRNVADDDGEIFLNGTGSGSPTTDNTTSSLANALTLRLGSQPGGNNDYQGEIYQAFIFRSAKSDSEVTDLDTVLDGTLSTLETFSISDSTSPATIAAIGAINSATIATFTEIVATAVEALGEIPTITLSAGSGITPATVNLLAGIPTATVLELQQISPATVTALGAIPLPAYLGGPRAIVEFIMAASLIAEFEMEATKTVNYNPKIG